MDIDIVTVCIISVSIKYLLSLEKRKSVFILRGKWLSLARKSKSNQYCLWLEVRERAQHEPRLSSLSDFCAQLPDFCTAIPPAFL